MLRTFITTAVACVVLGTLQAPAQQIDPPDPLGTAYATGDDAIAPEILARIPLAATHRAFLPARVDLKRFMPKPGKQGKMGSCQAWATGYAARTYYLAAAEGRDPNDMRNQPSPSYLYTLANTDPRCDGGSNIVTITEVMKRGAPSLADYPYSTECRRPDPQARARARDFRVRGFRNLRHQSLDNVKGQLARGHPVIISFRDGPTFHDHRGDSVFTDTTRFPDGTPRTGWHAMTLVGYDDSRQAFELINSWGTGWGAGGYAWISYPVFKTLVRQASILDVELPVRPVAFSPPASSPPIGPVATAPPTAKPPVAVAAPSPAPVQVAPASPSMPATPTLADLHGLTCADISRTARAGRTLLDGYVASEADYAFVQRIAATVPNTMVGTVLVAPWPQCEALQTLTKALTAPDSPEIVVDRKGVFRRGETLRIEIRTPAQFRYIYVAYVQADGSVINLVQPAGVVPQPTRPTQALVFGDGRSGRSLFTVGPPYGREMIIALASRSPLFDASLPTQMYERDYLSELRRALLHKPSPGFPDREVAASVFLLQTHE